jgi:hypothetical protein
VEEFWLWAMDGATFITVVSVKQRQVNRIEARFDATEDPVMRERNMVNDCAKFLQSLIIKFCIVKSSFLVQNPMV